MKKMLRTAKRVLDKVFGTKINELYWRYHHLMYGALWAEKYLEPESLNHPHRKFMLNAVAKLDPQSVLEFGCASGPNLYRLAKRFPGIKLIGIDISQIAVKTGEFFFQSRNVGNISFVLAKSGTDGLKKIPDKSSDVILSDAALIYIGPKNIKDVLREMVRIARKGIVLIEMHTESETFYNDNWVYNYEKILEELGLGGKAIYEKIPEAAWGGDWAKYGFVITIPL